MARTPGTYPAIPSGDHTRTDQRGSAQAESMISDAQPTRIYMDHAATTPPDSRVIDMMLPFLEQHWHNPSSIYVEAQQTHKAIEDARDAVALGIGARPEEIVFTSGGSESDTLALRGVVSANKGPSKHIVTTAVEHHAVLDTVEQLEREGSEVTILGVDRVGSVSPDDVAAAVRDDTVLVSVIHANNEVGTINDIAEIARAVHERNPRTVMHTDAVQSAAHLGVNVESLGVDLLSIAGHKMYGPRGVGVLYVRSGTPITSQILGGGQERNLRAGTENTAAIVGMSTAIRITNEERESDLSRDRLLQQALLDKLPRLIPMVGITGQRDPELRLPGSVSFVIGFVEGESILLALDLAGIAASSGSACTTGSIEPSHVLVAMGVPPELARGSLRLTLGRLSTSADIDRLLDVLPPIVERMRALSPVPVTEPPADWSQWMEKEQ